MKGTNCGSSNRWAADDAIALRSLRRSTSRDHIGQSALNAAQSFVQSGQTRLALDYIELAQRHPATRDQALALRARIGSVR